GEEDEEEEEVERLGREVVLTDPAREVEEAEAHPPRPLVAGDRPEDGVQRGQVHEIEGERRPPQEDHRAVEAGGLGQEGGKSEETGPREAGGERGDRGAGRGG